MASSGGKGKNKKKGKTIHLNSFLAEGEKAAPGYALANTGSSWVDQMENDQGNDLYTSPPSKIYLPTAPKAARAPDVDISKIPPQGPFKAFLANVPYDVDRSDIEDFFKDLKLKDVKLPREGGDENSGRLKGYAYAEFEDLSSLVEALSLSNETIKNRPIRIDIAGNQDGDRERGYRFEERVDRTPDDWRSAPREEQPRENRTYDRGAYGDRNAGQGYDERDSYSRSDREYSDRGSNDRGYGNRNYGDRGSSYNRDGYDNRVNERGPNRYDNRGPDRYDNRGPDRYDNRGPDRYDREPDRYDRGPDRYDRGPDRFDRGPDRYDRGPDRFDRRPNDRYDRGSDRNDRYDRGPDRNDRRYNDRYDRPPRDKYDRGYGERSDRSSQGSDDRGYGSRDRYDDRRYNNRDDGPPPESPDETPRERPRLQLQKRSVPVASNVQETTSSSSIFGGAKPVDTASKEREVEEKLARGQIEKELKLESSSNAKGSYDGNRRNEKPREDSRSSSRNSGGKPRRDSERSQDLSEDGYYDKDEPSKLASNRAVSPKRENVKLIPAPPPTTNAWTKKSNLTQELSNDAQSKEYEKNSHTKPQPSQNDEKNSRTGERKAGRNDDFPKKRDQRYREDSHGNYTKSPNFDRDTGSSRGDRMNNKSDDRPHRIEKDRQPKEPWKYEDPKPQDFTSANKFAQLIMDDNIDPGSASE